jgi:hypothetical protein
MRWRCRVLKSLHSKDLSLRNDCHNVPHYCNICKHYENISDAAAYLNLTAALNEQYAIWKLGYLVAQLLEALRYKTEGRGFHFRYGYWDFSLA